MRSQTLTQTQQSPVVLPGTWKLAAGRAITLQPREAGMLRVAHGQLWATFDGPHQGALNDSGDHILSVGAQVRVKAGQRLVVEAWNAQAPAYFSWDPIVEVAPVARPRIEQVVQPLSDLRLALVFGGRAAGRLVAGLAGLAWGLVAGRRTDGFADCAFKADARACRAQGAIS
jgi:hypothetical protein